MTTKMEFIQLLIAETNGRFNGVRRELQTSEIPPEIQELMKQKGKLKKSN
jgi:hypothetical protein